jgi:triacylglycerol lipase
VSTFYRSMFFILLTSILLTSCSTLKMPSHVTLPGPATNKAPIVLVHGFCGWGRSEMLGYYYWGGSIDLQQDLIDHGHPTLTTATGPVSSNWVGPVNSMPNCVADG